MITTDQMCLYRVYVGWKTRASRMDLTVEPQPPGTYSKPESIHRWKIAAREKQNRRASLIPCVASLEEVHVLNALGQPVASFSGVGYGRVARQFYVWLTSNEMFWRSTGSGPTRDDHPHRQWRKPWLVAHQVHTLSRILAYEIMATTTVEELSKASNPLLKRFIYDEGPEPILLDPIKKLLPADVQADIDPQTFVRLMYESSDGPTPILGGWPLEDAKICHYLCEKGEL